MIKRSLLILFILLVVPCFSQADDFTVTQQIMPDDAVPPTVPAPVGAIAVASSQIDITWGASTDDQSLLGYRLFRDGIHIATTTLLTYSDTGLLASTTYGYTVESFDWVYNLSTTSATATATTLPVSVSSTPSSTNQTGTRLGVRLVDLQLSPGMMQVSIDWKTNIYAQYSLRWGVNSEYDAGFVSNEIFKRTHQTIIPDLMPGTKYSYELVAYDQRGKEYILSRDTFTTLNSPDITAPANVSNLYVEVIDDSVVLFWTNPIDSDFEKNRVVRNYNFYPTDIFDGYILYQGAQESYGDSEAFSDFRGQYYTIFSYDTSGNVSSGATIYVEKKDIDAPTEINSDPQRPVIEYGDMFTDIDFSDVIVLQEGVVQRHSETKNSVVEVTNGSSILLQLPKILLPKNLKTILVTIRSLHQRPVSYILHLNQNKTVYQARIPVLVFPERYTLSFSIYDHQTKNVGVFDGPLEVQEVKNLQKEEADWYTRDSAGIFKILFTVFFLALGLFAVYAYFAYRQEQNN